MSQDHAAPMHALNLRREHTDATNPLYTAWSQLQVKWAHPFASQTQTPPFQPSIIPGDGHLSSRKLAPDLSPAALARHRLGDSSAQRNPFLHHTQALSAPGWPSGAAPSGAMQHPFIHHFLPPPPLPLHAPSPAYLGLATPVPVYAEHPYATRHSNYPGPPFPGLPVSDPRRFESAAHAMWAPATSLIIPMHPSPVFLHPSSHHMMPVVLAAMSESNVSQTGLSAAPPPPGPSAALSGQQFYNAVHQTKDSTAVELEDVMSDNPLQARDLTGHPEPARRRVRPWDLLTTHIRYVIGISKYPVRDVNLLFGRLQLTVCTSYICHGYSSCSDTNAPIFKGRVIVSLP